MALIVEIFVHEVSGGRRAPGEMAARNDAGGPVFEPAILEIEMYADGKHRMRDILGPARALRQRHVRPRIDVPVLSAVGAGMSRRIAPSRVGDDVTILAEQRFDDGEQLRIGDRLLRRGAAVQHRVTKHGRVLRVTLPAFVRRVAVENRADLVMQRLDLVFAKQVADDGVALALELNGFGTGRLGACLEIDATASDHGVPPWTRPGRAPRKA